MIPLIRLLHIINNGLCRLDDTLACLFLAALLILSLFQITNRQAWIDPMLRHLTVWIGFIGAAIATDADKHITIDILSNILPDPLLRPLRRFLSLFAAITALVLTWASVVFVHNEIAYASARTILSLPDWTMNCIFPYAFGVMALRFLLRAIAMDVPSIPSHGKDTIPLRVAEIKP